MLRLMVGSLLVLSGCDWIGGLLDRPADKPEDATGSTPIRYVICDDASQNCRVNGRFRSVTDCEYHQKFMSAFCDSVTTPGKIICDTTEKSKLSKSYCLP
jgi:hypothetical protein